MCALGALVEGVDITDSDKQWYQTMVGKLSPLLNVDMPSIDAEGKTFLSARSKDIFKFCNEAAQICSESEWFCVLQCFCVFP